MSNVGHAPLRGDTDGRAARSRTAPRSVTTSDVTRFAGMGIAVAVTAIVTIAVFASGVAGERSGSPGPLSPAHQRAGLACETCHGERAPAAVCADCHAGHGSVRAPHAARIEAGTLVCTTCHDPHNARSVVFAPDGDVALAAHGALTPLETETVYRPIERVSVPLIAAEACGRCHDLRAPFDPIRVCLGFEGQASQPALCFDEHRSPGTDDARGAAWEATRRVIESADPSAPAAAVNATSLAPIGFALAIPPLLGLVVLVGFQLVRRRKKAPARTNAMPTIVEKVRLPQIDTNTCLGCYACVDACPYDVLAIEDYVAVLVRPKDCCGLTLCEQVCPNGSLTITDGDPIDDRPNVSAALESVDQPGLYLAGDLTGAPLIRNAIHQGALAVKDIAARAPRARGEVLDLVVVGAGPAGISAALEAKASGLRYEVLEQGSVAESIRSFPRGKLVFDQPVSMPIAGDLWLAESTKEELLGKWLRIVHRERLAIREGHRVTAVTPPTAPNGDFVVAAQPSEGSPIALRARRVVLALGRRGTPRKLPVAVPDAALDRVHYSLADARSHAGMRAIVVGLGDVAMEAAIALARQPKTHVTVLHRGDGFSRGKARNVAEVERLAREGRVELVFSAEITSVDRERVRVSARDVPYDVLFVMIGSLPPWPFLEAAGVRRVRDQKIEGGPRPGPEAVSEDGPVRP